jgi:hypothetical protein
MREGYQPDDEGATPNSAAPNEEAQVAGHADGLDAALLDKLYPGPWAQLLVPLCHPTKTHWHGDDPCESPGKAPLEAGYNVEALRRMEEDRPETRNAQLESQVCHLERGSGNVGLVLPPRTLALDADNARSSEVLQGLLPDVPRQTTGRGAHFLVKLPEPCPDIRKGSGIELWDGVTIDVKSPGQHVVVGPSVHKNRRRYEWVRPLPADPAQLPEIPADILDALTRPKAEVQPVQGRELIPEGRRDVTLTSLAGSMRWAGFTHDEMEAALLVANRDRCGPPLDEAQVSKIAKSVARYAPAAYRAYGAYRAPQPAADTWPAPLAAAAFHGPAGDFVRILEPHTEADSAALLVQLLALFGAAVGREPHFRVEADLHYPNLFVAIVGQTAKGRKGVSLGHARRVMELADPTWTKANTPSGLSSGEGLIWDVRDGDEEKDDDNGVADKRRFVIESELASTLRVLGRQGNNLSPLLRLAWDTGDLKTMTKNSPARATGAHIGLVGHITIDELRRYLTQTEMGNGFANRYLWVCARRSKELPEGGDLASGALDEVVGEVAKALKFGRELATVQRDEEARLGA